MGEPIRIGPTRPQDHAALEQLYRAAFPSEDLLPLLGQLLHDTPGVRSRAAWLGEALVGHVALTPCSVGDAATPVVLLGPLAVQPSLQRRGLGSRLVRGAIEEAQSAGFARILVLGDPRFYGRLGFMPETDVLPPYDLPPEWADAWRSIALAPPRQVRGKLAVPVAWRSPALWSS